MFPIVVNETFSVAAVVQSSSSCYTVVSFAELFIIDTLSSAMAPSVSTGHRCNLISLWECLSTPNVQLSTHNTVKEVGQI